jgi:O-succinylbenzoate synthase
MAAMQNFSLPGDTSASERYYRRDLTQPFVLHEGRLDVPQGPGLGVDVDMEFLESITTWKQTVGAVNVRR